MSAVLRRTPLVLVAVSGDSLLAQQCVDDWVHAGAMTIRAHDAQSCLRVATSVGPDVIVVDRRFPRSLVGLLKAHPVSRVARLEFAASRGPSAKDHAAELVLIAG